MALGGSSQSPFAREEGLEAATGSPGAVRVCASGGKEPRRRAPADLEFHGKQ